MTEAIAPDEAHLWNVWPELITDSHLLHAYERLLSDQERARRARFVFPEDRHLYLVTRALVRTTLSKYSNIPAEQWTFTTNAYGRPEICLPEESSLPLTFNVSHTRGLIACLVSLDRDVGVDVEQTGRAIPVMEIAGHCLSPIELAAFKSLPENDRQQRFCEYWTLKESYIKACGQGLSLPLQQFSFHLDDGPIRISFGPDMADDPAAWQFALYHPAPQYVLAVSIRRARDAAVRIQLRETVPLVC